MIDLTYMYKKLIPDLEHACFLKHTGQILKITFN